MDKGQVQGVQRPGGQSWWERCPWWDGQHLAEKGTHPPRKSPPTMPGGEAVRAASCPCAHRLLRLRPRPGFPCFCAGRCLCGFCVGRCWIFL